MALVAIIADALAYKEVGPVAPVEKSLVICIVSGLSCRSPHSRRWRGAGQLTPYTSIVFTSALSANLLFNTYFMRKLCQESR
jgi:hypothetical protein